MGKTVKKFFRLTAEISFVTLILTSDHGRSKEKPKNEEPKSQVVEVEGGRPFAASLVATFKDSQNIYSMISKNKWFLDFRQSSLYYGLLYDLYPSLFSLPDEFSVSKESTWKGRLIDYVYETILKNRPIQVSYYQQARLVSPWGLSVNDLTSTESKVIEQLVKIFRIGDEREIQTRQGKTTKVSLIEIKAQKWAVKKDGSCFTIGKDPVVVADIAKNCKAVKLNTDLEIEANLSLLFPGLMTLRSKVIGLEEKMKIPFQWNASENRYDLAPVSLSVTKDNIFVSRKIGSETLKSIPLDSHFFVAGNIRIWNGAMSVDSVKSFLASKKRTKEYQKQAAAVLVQMPVKTGDKVNAETALIFESGSINQSQLDNIGKIFETKFGEVYARPVCSKVLVVSRSKELVQKVQEVCDRKSPSILDRTEIKTGELSTQDSSLSFFADVGKWISGKIEAGYVTKAKEKKLSTAIPEELVKSQKLLEQLPKYLVRGTTKEQNLILK